MSGKFLVLSFFGAIAVNLLLLLLVVHDRWFLEEPEGHFFLTVLDASTLRIGQVLVLISILVGLYIGVMPSTDVLGQRFLNVLRLLTSERVALVALSVGLTLSSIGLAYLFFSGARFYPVISQGSSSVLITPDGLEMYFTAEADGAVFWQDLQTPHAKYESIRIGRNGDLQAVQVGQETGSLWTPGQPSQLAYVPHADQILVTDVKFNSIVVISRRTHRAVHIISGVGFAPRSIVVTPDGRKAYVGSEQPIPTGQIAVIDLLAKPYPQLEETKISVPSPEGMAIRGRRLYVATQSGAGHDAVFVVNTVTDRILDWVPGFAVGIKLAVVGQAGKKLYVSRGHSLGVVDLSMRKLRQSLSIALDTSTTVIGVTEDGRTALVANGTRLTAIDTDHDAVRLSVDLPAAANGIAISKNRAYALIPQAGQLLTFDIRSLLPGPESQ